MIGRKYNWICLIQMPFADIIKTIIAEIYFRPYKTYAMELVNSN